MELSKEYLKGKSEELKMPFADYLRQIMQEDLLYKVIPNERPVCFILESDSLLKAEAQRQRREQPIAFAVKADVDSAGEQFRSSLTKEGDISWRVCHEILEEDRQLLRFSVEGSIEDMKVPFTVTIQQKEGQTVYMDLGSYKGLLRKETLDYKVCAPELRLAECLYYILNRLELISSMEYYDDAARILSSNSVDGRRVAEDLAEKLKANYEPKLPETIKEYGAYKYMEKRWISYEKNKAFNQKKKESREWTSVVSIIVSFLNPVYESLCRDEIFIGDWMPELKRFM